MAVNPYSQMESYKQRKLSKLGGGVKLPNITENINRIQTTSQGIQRRSGVPVSTQINLQRENEMAAGRAFSETATPIYLEREKEKDILRDQIMELSIKSDQFDEAEKEKRDAEKDAKNKMWTKLGFTALGGLAVVASAGLAAPAVAGAAGAAGAGAAAAGGGLSWGSLMGGLAIGSGVGDMAAGLGVGTGEFGEADQIDEGLIAQGLMNTVGAVSSEIKLAKPKAMTSLLGENTDAIMGMSDTDLTRFSDTIKLYTASGNYDQAIEYIKKMFAGGSAGGLGLELPINSDMG